MPVRTTRVRLRVLAAAAAVLAALLLSGCKDGTGVRDEGPSGVTPTSAGSTP
jgi:outer membrane murein-binding lipoprotein Lpp